MTLLVAALLGVLQGLTEFLPISSTAHLLLAGDLVGYDDPGEAFTVMIQLGSILAVMWLFRAKIISVIRGLPSDPAARRFALMILIAFLPALFAGALLNDFVEQVLAESPRVIAIAFIVGAAGDAARRACRSRRCSSSRLTRRRSCGRSGSVWPRHWR